jgi:hypothetical protein
MEIPTHTWNRRERYKWQDNTVMDLKETGRMWKRIHLAQDREQ